MRQVTFHPADKEYSHFVELAEKLHYVKKIETDENNGKADILNNINAGLEEIKLFRKGKLKTTTAKNFLIEESNSL